MRVLAMVTLAIAAGACERTPASRSPAAESSRAAAAVPGETPPAWKLGADTSEMDGTKTASLTATSIVGEAGNRQRAFAMLAIRCRPGHTELALATTSQLETEAQGGNRVRLRVGAGQPEVQEWAPSRAGSALFAPRPIALARRLAAADTIRVEYTPFREGPAVAVFTTEGLATKLPALAKECAWDTTAASIAYDEHDVDTPVAAVPSSPAPRYPESLRARSVEGEVRARFVVDTMGRAEPASFVVLSSSDALFTEAVRAALPRMRFTPAVKDGHRVRQVVEQPFTFSITR